MEKPPSTGPADTLARLVPSGITFLSVVGLILVARFYDFLPIKPAPCGLRTVTGIPCLACGGTRSIRALAQGNILDALSLNPLAVAGVLAAILWFAVVLWRTLSGIEPRTKKRISTRWIVAICLLLGAANWIYLILFLPE